MGLKQQVLDGVEALIVKAIEDNVPKAVEAALAKIAELIPGKLDDEFIALKKPEIVAYVIAELKKQADKVDGQVG